LRRVVCPHQAISNQETDQCEHRTKEQQRQALAMPAIVGVTPFI